MQEKVILIVEDDCAISNVLSDYLQMEGFEVRQATNGLEALQQINAAKNTKISAILLDMMMPVMDGKTFASELQKTENSSIPIIVMTADGHIVEKAKAVGADAFVRKPIELDELITAIQKIV